MRHTPCGCRSAHLVEVQPNFRLPPVSTMRRASAMPHSVGSLPPRKRHSRLTTVRRGCCQITTRRDSWRSHVHRTHTAQRVQPFKLQTRNGGVKGQGPLRSLGGPRGIFSHVREYPPFPVQRQRRCFFPETFLTVSEKRFQLLCAVISEKRIKRRIHRAAAKVAVNAHMLDALVEVDISCAVAGRGVVGCTQ